MRLSLQTVQRAFDEIAQLGIDNKFWGILTIVKNVKKYLKLPTSIGTMSLIVCDKNGVQNDLKNFFLFKIQQIIINRRMMMIGCCCEKILLLGFLMSYSPIKG